MSTLANVRDVLHLIARLQREVTVTDVSNHLGIPMSSASRTLSLMAKHELLARDDDSLAYRTGPLIFEASRNFRARNDTLSLLDDELAGLVESTGYTGYINLLSEGTTLVLKMRAGAVGSLQIYTPEGTRGTPYATSMGRAMLSRLSDDEAIASIDDNFQNAVGSAPSNADELRTALGEIRQQGWALSRGEMVKNVAGISAAVREPDSSRIFGIGLAFSALDLDSVPSARIGALVRDAARRVGTQLGDSYWLDYTGEGHNEGPEKAAGA